MAVPGWSGEYAVVSAANASVAAACRVLEDEPHIFLPYDRPGLVAPRLPGMVRQLTA
jgi:hypothetical protein